MKTTKKNLNEDVSTITDVQLGIMLYKTLITTLGTATLAGIYGLFRGGLALFDRNYHKCIKDLKAFCIDLFESLPKEQANEFLHKRTNEIVNIVGNALFAATYDKNTKVAKNAKTLLKFFDKHIVSKSDSAAYIDFYEIISDVVNNLHK